MSGDGDRVAGKEGGLRHSVIADVVVLLTLVTPLLNQRQKRASTDCVVSFATV